MPLSTICCMRSSVRSQYFLALAIIAPLDSRAAVAGIGWATHRWQSQYSQNDIHRDRPVSHINPGGCRSFHGIDVQSFDDCSRQLHIVPIFHALPFRYPQYALGMTPCYSYLYSCACRYRQTDRVRKALRRMDEKKPRTSSKVGVAHPWTGGLWLFRYQLQYGCLIRLEL